MGLAGVGSVGYVHVLEPEWLGVGRHEVPLAQGALGPLKILHLSDLHASPVVEMDFISRAVRLGLEQQPDVICLTGDFITRGYEHFDRFAEVLKPLADAAPTFACLGNHDGGAWSSKRNGYQDSSLVRGMLAKAGIDLLHNSARALQSDKWNLTLIGLGDVWAAECHPASAFETLEETDASTRIVLAHNPDTKERLKPYRWDLLLCGHTHGGQVRIPFGGAPFAPVRDKRFVEGLHPWDGRWLHVTRGVGNLHGIRFNCPPEVSLLTLT